MDHREVFHAAHVLQQHEHVAVTQTLDRQARRRLSPGVVEEGFHAGRQFVGPVAQFARAHRADVVLAGVHLLELQARREVVLVGRADVVAGGPEGLEHRAHRARDVEEVCDPDVPRPGREVVDEERELLVGIRFLAQAHPAGRHVGHEIDAVGHRDEGADFAARLARANRRQRLNAFGLGRHDVADVLEARDPRLRARDVVARHRGVDRRGVDARAAEVADELDRRFRRTGEHRAGEVERHVVVDGRHQRLARLGGEEVLARDDVRVEDRGHRADDAHAAVFPTLDRRVEHRLVPVGQEQVVGDEADPVPGRLPVRRLVPGFVPLQVRLGLGEHAAVRRVVDPFVLDLGRERRLAVVRALHEMLHEVEEHVADVLDAAVVPVPASGPGSS